MFGKNVTVQDALDIVRELRGMGIIKGVVKGRDVTIEFEAEPTVPNFEDDGSPDAEKKKADAIDAALVRQMNRSSRGRTIPGDE